MKRIDVQEARKTRKLYTPIKNMCMNFVIIILQKNVSFLLFLCLTRGYLENKNIQTCALSFRDPTSTLIGSQETKEMILIKKCATIEIQYSFTA